MKDHEDIAVTQRVMMDTNMNTPGDSWDNIKCFTIQILIFGIPVERRYRGDSKKHFKEWLQLF